MTFILGLTGSIGMGKSTTAEMFRALGIPVWDADKTVHDLYAEGGAALAPLADLIPGAVSHNGVDRGILRQAIRADPEILPRIEAIVHPLVAADRAAFIQDNQTAPLVVLDIPLLYENHSETLCDAVAVVTTDAAEQRRRVLARGTDPQTFEDLLARQMPDAEKRARADHVIRTDTLDGTRQIVADLVQQLSIPTP